MRRHPVLFALALAALTFAASGVFAQVPPPVPDLQNRIPEPLPPPPEPPIINGPLGRSPHPGVAPTKRLNTFSDRVTNCIHNGSSAGLRGRRLNAYVGACANDN